MSILKVPSLQHLARNWKDKPELIAKALVKLAEHPPTFNYNPLHSAVRDLLVLGVPYDQVLMGINRIKRSDVRENLLEVVPLIKGYFSGIAPTYYQTVERRFYPVGRGLMIPFEPPMIFGVNGQLHFPWFSFWRSNPLAGEKLSLFATLVDEILLQDPDLENAHFQILDFSCPKKSKFRDLTVIDAKEIPRLTTSRKNEMLSDFADGYFLALDQLKGKSEKPKDGSVYTPTVDQPDLF